MPISHAGTWPEGIREAIDKRLPPKVRKYLTPRMIKMLIIVGGVLVLVFGYIVASPFVAFLMTPKGAFIQIQAVSTVRAQKTQWQGELRSIGSLHAVQGADLSAEITGLVTKIGFTAGQDVRKGVLLIQLRDDSDRAQLAALRASAELARLTYMRDAALIKSNAISQTDYDTALANMKNTRAQADAQAATVEKKAIRAPYDGRVGIRQVDIGQYVNAGQVVVTLQQLDPIYVDFQVQEQQLSQLSVGDKVGLTTDAVAGATFTGEIVAFDPKIDPDTRNVHVRAMIANPAKKLLPGMFATVLTNVGRPSQRVTLPLTALTFSPYGDTVYVVAKDGKDDDGKDKLIAQQRFVTIGETRGDQVAILSGITSKDVVITSGQLKLKNGSFIKVNNGVPLPNDPAPTPVQQ
jgi:membrane fusion protein (multidrug efflux system)